MRWVLASVVSGIVAVGTTAVWADERRDCLEGIGHDLRIKGCSELLDRNPNDALAHYTRGIVYQSKGDMDRAISDYNKAIELNPYHASVYDSRARAYASKGDLANAVADATKARELRQESLPAPTSVAAGADVPKSAEPTPGKATPAPVIEARRGWVGYHNERFGFSLSYPADIFKADRASEAGDGQVFVASNGDARLLVGALPNTDGHTPASYQDFIARQSYRDYQVDYRPRGGNWFVLSGEGRGKIFYEKVMFTCAGRLLNSFALIYPAASRQIFDPIVERIEDTFRPGTKECGPRQAAGLQTETQPRIDRQGGSTRVEPAPRVKRQYPRVPWADRIARRRGSDVIIVLRRVGPPYNYRVVRGFASR